MVRRLPATAVILSSAVAVFMFAGYSYAEKLVVTTPDELQAIVEKNNYDLKLLNEQVKRASAVVSGVEGAYYPELSADVNFRDDQKEPSSNFMPSRTQNLHWGATLTQKSPWGLTGSVGLTTDWTKFFQTEPPNTFLPYPLALNQPVLFVKLEADILQDLKGYISFKEWDQVRIDEEVSTLQTELAKHKLLSSGKSMMWGIRAMNEMGDVTEKIVAKLEKLEKDVALRVKRRLANEGDLYKLRAAISQRKADLVAIARGKREMEKTLNMMLASREEIAFRPSRRLDSISEEVSACEGKMLDEAAFDTAWSTQFDLLEKNIKRGRLERDIRYRKALPSLKVVGSYARTGVDENLETGIEEMFGGDRPQYYIGLNLMWPFSESVAESKKIFGDSALETQSLLHAKQYEESKSLYDTSRAKIRDLQREGELIDEAIGYGKKEIEDLEERFKQGRVTMFELVQEESAVFQSELKRKQIWLERINNVYTILGSFDRFECGAKRSASRR